jgi:hypothetical protein
MTYFNRGVRKIMIFIGLCLLIVVTLPRFSPLLFPPLPVPTADFDCDDGTLAMYEHFRSLGADARPFIGNLNMKGEEFMEADHVWLMVSAGDKCIAYDWGRPRFDSQHYEGYAITVDELLYAVAKDIENQELPAEIY